MVGLVKGIIPKKFLAMGKKKSLLKGAGCSLGGGG
jgi:hypothetical protein